MTLSGSSVNLDKRVGTPFDQLTAQRSKNGGAAMPTTFAELEKTTKSKGRCERCPAPATVRLQLLARPITNPGGNGTPKALAKHQEALCEPCAVKTYLGVTG